MKNLAELSEMKVEFGAAAARLAGGPGDAVMQVPLPLLEGPAQEKLLRTENFLGTVQGWMTWSSGDIFLGAKVTDIDSSLEEATLEAYRGLLLANADRHFYRIWNYVPAINGMVAGEENYRAFCAGRARAFESAWGDEFARMLPAASAVGCPGNSLVTIFVSGSTIPEHFENDAQVPAYRYPPEHGRRSPSFSRATAGSHAGHPLFFISGTAAIRGHETVAPEKFDEQLDCTLENLRGISEKCGLGSDFAAADTSARRHYKIYLRRPEDLAAAREKLRQNFLQPGDEAIYLQADICRPALRVEIEATIIL